jgi:hypothetical protein
MIFRDSQSVLYVGLGEGERGEELVHLKLQADALLCHFIG